MSNRFYAINRGQEGFKTTDVVRGTASTAGADIELRVADGASLTRLDVIKALDAFERIFINQNVTESAVTYPAQN